MAAVALIAAVAAVRWPFVRAADCIDSDAAVVVLMARHFAHGELAPYFWGQRFMGALEPALLTPLAWFHAATATTAAVAAIAVVIAQMFMSMRLGLRLGAKPLAIACAWLVPAGAMVLHQVRFYGARAVATLIALLAMELALRRRWRLAGLLGGIALYGDHLMAMWIVPLATLALRDRAQPRGAISRFACGLLPVVAIDVVLALRSHGGIVLPQPPVHWLRNVGYLFVALARLAGDDWLLWRDRSTIAWCIATLAQLCVVVVVLIGALRRREEAGECSDCTTAPRQALVLVVALSLVAYIAVARDTESFRYLIPAWPAATMLFGIGVASLPRAWQLAAPFIALPAAFSLALQQEYPVGALDGDRCHDEAVVVRRAIESSGVRGLYADYWNAYRLALLLDERVPIAAFNGDRRPDWTQAVKRARPVGYLVSRTDLERMTKSLRPSAIVDAGTWLLLMSKQAVAAAPDE